MSGIDTILAQFVENEIKKNLSPTAIQKIEKRLFEKYGISLTESINQFEKFDDVLQEFFGQGAKGLEQKAFKKLLAIGKSEKTKDYIQIIIKNPDLANQIMTIIADKEKFGILVCVFDQSRISSEIIRECHLAQTSGYRKIKELFRAGFLIEDGYITTSDGKKAYKFKSFFGPTKIDTHKDKISVKTHILKQHAKTSKLLQVFEMPLAAS